MLKVKVKMTWTARSPVFYNRTKVVFNLEDRLVCAIVEVVDFMWRLRGTQIMAKRHDGHVAYYRK